MKSEPTEYQIELFNWMTLRLMAAKYAYYIENKNYVDDLNYDLSEKDWYKFGLELGLLTEDETSPCIDFDFNHPMANDAQDLALFYLGRCRDTDEINALLRKYKQIE